MKLLLIHANKMSWKVQKKALKSAPEPEFPEASVKDPLVVFVAVEQSDESQEAKRVKQAVKEIQSVADQVKAKSIVLYPYAHLSSSLSNPTTAQSVLAKLSKVLQAKQAPFGYYKSFTLDSKGHPLSELSRDISDVQKPKPLKTGKIILDRRSLKPWDHRILGEDLGLFHFADEVGNGLPLWLPKGETLRNLLIQFMRQQEERAGYHYVSTPHITKGSLYESSGHLPYYKDSMYNPIDLDGVEYYLKPMNCPHHHMIYNKLVKSYRDLPLKLAEAGTCYRHELSGVLYGLIRVLGFTQNDAHLYVTPDQLKDEFVKVIQLFDHTYKALGMKDYWFRLSLPDFKESDKFTGDPKAWDHASEEIRKAMKTTKKNVIEVKGEAAFYGPKIDVQIRNSQGKEETIATSQVDVVVPKRMGLVYTDNSDKPQHPIVIHHAFLGSYERFIAYILEQTKGNLPVWLSPVQVVVASFTERNTNAVLQYTKKLQKAGIRAESDIRNNTINHKVRDAELQKIPYILVIGDREEKEKTVAVRSRGGKNIQSLSRQAFLQHIKKEVDH